VCANECVFASMCFLWFSLAAFVCLLALPYYDSFVFFYYYFLDAHLFSNKRE
jgi:membrane protein implicated in regulation of membrane protease activity